MKYGAPTKSIFEFNGNLKLSSNPSDEIKVELKQFLFKGSKLKNSGKVYGLVVYTGKESKIMLNSGNYTFKQSRMEQVINYGIFFNILILVMMAVIYLIEHVYWVK